MTRRSLLKLFGLLGALCALPAAGRPRYSFSVVYQKCTGCGDCSRICPVDAIRFIRKKAHIDPQTCTKCTLCYSTCSYGAIAKCLLEQDSDQ